MERAQYDRYYHLNSGFNLKRRLAMSPIEKSLCLLLIYVENVLLKNSYTVIME